LILHRAERAAPSRAVCSAVFSIANVATGALSSTRLMAAPADPRTRWVTFDCYGTLVDWQAGFAEILQPIAGAKTPGLLPLNRSRFGVRCWMFEVHLLLSL